MAILHQFWALLGWRNAMSAFFYMVVMVSVLNGVLAIFASTRKIQPKGFKWQTYRNEVLFALFNVAFSGLFIGGLTSFLNARGWTVINKSPAHWWVVAGEYALFFFAFDTWFYWCHRLMHKEPIYRWVHKIHHRSTSPNLLTTLSVSPLESLVNGGFTPLFTAVIVVHSSSLMLMTLTTGLMGLYVHAGHEFLPRWWTKSWATKWFITSTFHDQHHKYFNWNFGGFTTIWDYICGTGRRKYEEDFEKIATRRKEPASALADLSEGVSCR